MLLPASIGMIAPVIIVAASEHRYAIRAATSSGSIIRPKAAASGALASNPAAAAAGSAAEYRDFGP